MAFTYILNILLEINYVNHFGVQWLKVYTSYNEWLYSLIFTGDTTHNGTILWLV